MFWQVSPLSKIAGKYHIQALPEACVGPLDQQFFMGGVALASAIDALQTEFQKPLSWAHIQFHAHGMRGDDIEVDVARLSGGKSIVQAGTTVSTDGRVLQTVMASLGSRDSAFEAQFVKAPEVPKPSDCPPKAPDAFAQPGNLLDQFERRVAYQDDSTGKEYLWFRPNFECEISAPLLAILADFFLGAHTATRGGTSLDNSFRVFDLSPSKWILNVTQLAGIKTDMVQGQVHQFSEDGRLLATGSQTGLLPRR